MTNKEKMLKMVLDNKKLQDHYGYNKAEYDNFYTALNSNNVVVSAVAQIINDLNGSTTESDQKKVYMTVFNYIKDNYLL